MDNNTTEKPALTHEDVAKALTELGFTFTAEGVWQHGRIQFFRLVNDPSLIVYQVGELDGTMRIESTGQLKMWVKILKDEKGHYAYLPS